MWVFLNDAMFSFVQDRVNANELVCRARVRGDIEKVFPGADVKESTESDYRFRAWIKREVVATAMKNEVDRINYFNFKDSIAKEDNDRHSAYIGVWSAMQRLQETLYGYSDWWINYRNPVKSVPKVAKNKKKNWQK